MVLYASDLLMAFNWATMTVVVLSAEVLLFSCFVGVGLAARRGFGLRTLSVDDVFVAFWMGFGITTLFLVTWNFAFPVYDAILYVFGLSGVAALWSWRVELLCMRRSARGGRYVLAMTALAVVGIWMANISMVELKQWDSESYHIQAVKWAQVFPVVPGLANLHGWLALNNSSFLYDAMLDSGLLSSRAYHVANGLLVFALFGQGILATARVFGVLKAPSPASIFDVVLLAPAVTLVAPDKITSYATDPPVTAVSLVALSLLYRYLSGGERWTDKERAYAMVCIGSLLSVAISVKLNHAVFGGVAWLVTAVVWLRRDEGYRLKTALWAAGFSAALLAGVMLRGVVLSGWPVFPGTVLGAPVEWRAPVEHARAEYAMIVHSGRNTVSTYKPGSGVESIERWFPFWIRHSRRSPYELLVPLTVTCVISVCYLALVRGNRHRRAKANNAAWLLLAPTGAALIAWFVTAPEPRYAMHWWWGIVALLLAQGARQFGPWLGVGLNRGIVCCLIGVILGAAVMNAQFMWLWIHSDKDYGMLVLEVLSSHVRRPSRDGTLPKLPTPAVLGAFVTTSGLRLNVPLRNGGRCMDAPLPCTPNPASNVRLRDPGNLGAGFVVEGGWRMQNWPFEFVPDFLPALRKRWQLESPPVASGQAEQSR